MKDINYLKKTIKNRKKHLKTLKYIDRKYGYHPELYKKPSIDIVNEIEILESILNKIK